MTREELAAEIEHTLVEHRADCVLAERTAAAVIRLVVEACAAEMPAFQAHYLRSTFLPPEARDGEAD